MLQTDRTDTDRQRSDSIGRTVLQTVAQKATRQSLALHGGVLHLVQLRTGRDSARARYPPVRAFFAFYRPLQWSTSSSRSGVCVCLSVWTITFERNYLVPRSVASWFTLILPKRSRSEVKVHHHMRKTLLSAAAPLCQTKGYQLAPIQFILVKQQKVIPLPVSWCRGRISQPRRNAGRSLETSAESSR